MYRKVWKIGKPHQAHIKKKEDTHHIPTGVILTKAVCSHLRKTIKTANIMQYKTMNQHNCALILNGTLLWIEELYLYDKEPQMRIFYIKIVPSLNPIVVSCDI
jgi:hypothetical protein